MAYRALIPVKTLSEAKSRLAPHLTQIQRATLVLEMLRHVIHTLQASGSLESVSVVSSDPRVLDLVPAWGAQALVEEQPGHNPALHAAALREIATGATALLTISADLPLLQAQDIRTIVEQSKHYDVVLAPSREGTGTSALLARPPLVVPYVFGINSLQRYKAEAQQRHLSSTIYHSTDIALDIDTIEDLELFRRYEKERMAIHALSCM